MKRSFWRQPALPRSRRAANVRRPSSAFSLAKLTGWKGNTAYSSGFSTLLLASERSAGASRSAPSFSQVGSGGVSAWTRRQKSRSSSEATASGSWSRRRVTACSPATSGIGFVQSDQVSSAWEGGITSLPFVSSGECSSKNVRIARAVGARSLRTNVSSPVCSAKSSIIQTSSRPPTHSHLYHGLSCSLSAPRSSNGVQP